jgi:hypothetical protein
MRDGVFPLGVALKLGAGGAAHEIRAGDNLKIAKELGLTISRVALLLVVDDVVE